jgi:malate dehydrogenase (oxaloacetate-decarboxylating)
VRPAIKIEIAGKLGLGLGQPTGACPVHPDRDRPTPAVQEAALPTPSPGYSITLRVEAPANPSATAELSAAVGKAGGVLTALDVRESHYDRIVVDVTCNACDGDHADAITQAVAALAEMTVRKVSDRTFLMHLGGKLEVTSKVQLRHRDDLYRAYTPGVARVCQAIAANPEDARRLTIKRNTVAVVTDGSAVLGLGNLGPAAALPVMEGKAALFKRFADVDAWPVCLDTQDPDAIVEIVRAIAPVYGGINLEDIAAPRCFEIEARLRELLDIPVFHDDQHGTSIVVLAALTNALRVVNKSLPQVRIVVAGAGAAGQAIIRLLLGRGATDVVAFDSRGAVHGGRDGLDPFKSWIAEHTNQAGFAGTLREGIAGADVFIGVSAPNLLTGVDLAKMNDKDRAGLANRPGGRPVGGPAARRRGRDRAQRLPEPDQQRAGVSRRVPGAARRRGPRHHRRDARRRGHCHRRRGAPGRAEPQLHRAERLRPRGRPRRGRRRPSGCHRLTRSTAVDDDLARFRRRVAQGYEADPHGAAVRRFLALTPARPVLGRPLADLVRVTFDWSAGTDAASWTSQRLFAYLAEVGAEVGVGRYLEDRDLYTAEAYAGAGDAGAGNAGAGNAGAGNAGAGNAGQWRTVHLGVDLLVPPGTPVFAPLNGVVQDVNDNAAPQDYGPVVILAHRTDTGDGFFTLYGHLARSTLPGLSVGQQVGAGERFAAVGTEVENGGWAPHLHFQVLTSLLGRGVDVPGVGVPADLRLWRSVCPDPNLLLGLPEGTRAVPGVRRPGLTR